MMYNFWQLAITPILLSWFLAQTLSNFVSLLWKLYNRHCHNLQTFDKNWYAFTYWLTYTAFAFCTCGKKEILRTQKLYSRNQWSCSKWVGDKIFKSLHLSMNTMWVLITKIVINTFVVWINAIHSRIFVLLLLIADMGILKRVMRILHLLIFIAQKNLIVTTLTCQIIL